MIEWIPLIGCVCIAFVVGSNDTSNALGICVGCGIMRFARALLLFGPWMLLGILLQGQKVMKTVGRDLLEVNISVLGVALVVSALLIITANWRKLPLSSHQVIVGSLTGAGAASGIEVHMDSLLHIALSWVVSPLSAFLCAFVIYRVMEKTLAKLPVFVVERILNVLLLMNAVLISYNTGANELATVLGGAVYSGLLSPMQASFGGSALLFLGAALLSSRVIETVGKGITPLDPFSGFAAQFGAAASVLVFTTFGMPISTTYCIIGGIVAVGVLKGMGTVRTDLLKKIAASWVVAPAAAFMLCFCLTRAITREDWVWSLLNSTWDIYFFRY